MNKNVLVLDDNAKILFSVKKALENIYGTRIKVYTCMTYEDACLTAHSIHIDVFVLDIILTTKTNGDTSGLKFAQELRNHIRYVFTPIIFLTTLEDPSNEAMHTFHCFDYLEKPFPPEKVADVVGKALGFYDMQDCNTPITMRKDGILYVINPRDIVYVDVNQHVLNIHMKDDLLSIPNRTLKQFFKEVNLDGFVQCSRNTVVNSVYIDVIDPVNHFIRIKGMNISIEISRFYLNKILEGFHNV